MMNDVSWCVIGRVCWYFWARFWARYFARVDDSYLWGYRERVKTVNNELYESYPCLWDFRSPEYKVVSKKKLAKVEIGKHSGWSGKQLVALTLILTVSLTLTLTQNNRPTFIYTPGLKKTVHFCLCQNFVKFPRILIRFGRQMAKWLKFYAVSHLT